MGLHADGVDHGVGAAAVGAVAHGIGDAVLVAVEGIEIEHVDAPLACSVEAFGDEVDADHHLDPAVAGDPAGHVADRAETENDEAATRGHLGVLGLPARPSAARRRGRRSGRRAGRLAL